MEPDLPRFGGDIERCGMPLRFRSVGFSSGFGSRPLDSQWASLAVRIRTTRLAVITFSLSLYHALCVAFLLTVRRGRVLWGNNRCGGGLATGTGEFLEEIPEFTEN
ncbi:MAG: hypothetical protein HW407_586 [Bacteroidetes bacterium]|nr:hypothetical protein [Bacteroidota bacterium]